MKACTKCNVEKPFTEFNKDSGAPSGLSYTCKSCAREASRAWHQANKDTEAFKARRDAYSAYRKTDEFRAKRRATRDLVKNREDCKKYAAKNKEKIAARHKANRLANPEKEKKIKRLTYEKHGKRYARNKIDNLSDNYIKNIITSRSEGLTYADIPQAMVDVKRLQILIRREVLENTTAEERRAATRAKTKAKNPTKDKEYYLNNKEKANAASKAWRAKNIEKVRARERERRALNREKINAQARARYNPEKQREKGLEYRLKHRDELLIKSRAKYAENKEEINAKRRNITPEQRAHINALARAAVARRKLTNQQGVAK